MSEERFARQYLCGPPAEFLLPSTCTSIVHHLSGPNIHAQASSGHPKNQLTADEEHLSVIKISVSLRRRVYNSNTRTYVRLLGPCFKTGRITTPMMTSRRWNGRSRSNKPRLPHFANNQGKRHTTTDEKQQSNLYQTKAWRRDIQVWTQQRCKRKVHVKGMLFAFT